MFRDEYVQFDATGLAELVRSGEASAEELLQAAVEQIGAVNPQINAVVSENLPAAKRFAATVSADKPFSGVPFLAKDMNVEVAGLPLTQSSQYLNGGPDTEDSELAVRWRKAGLNIVGRSNSPEFAGDFVTEPTWRGASLNPWDTSRTPGGSSGGAAAAVASGMVPMAHGSDSGGSIRVPAAACGLVGFKPSRGLIPSGPHHDELAGGLNVDHALTRSVRDTATLLDAAAGHERGGRVFVDRPTESFLSSINGRLGPLTIGLCVRAPSGVEADDVVATATHNVARLLATQGHRIKEIHLGSEVDALGIASILWMSAIAEEVEWHHRSTGSEPRREFFEALTWYSIQQAKGWSATDYLRARRSATALTRALDARLEGVDVLLTPTTASLPVQVGSVDSRTNAFNFDVWAKTAYQYAPFTELFNITGQPAISLPLGWTASGFPIGVQVVAKLGRDAQLLRIASHLEKEMPWRDRLQAHLKKWAALDFSGTNSVRTKD